MNESKMETFKYNEMFITHSSVVYVQGEMPLDLEGGEIASTMNYLVITKTLYLHDGFT